MISTEVSVSTIPRIDESFLNAKMIAQDYLQGVHDDYMFFYLDSGIIQTGTYYDRYILLVGDLAVDSGEYVFSDCQVYQIDSVRTVYVDNSKLYNFSGTSIDLDSSPLGSFSGTLESSDRLDYHYSLTTLPYFRDSVTVSFSSGQYFYSSLATTPHLIEGVQNYAYAGFCLCAVILAFKLADRIMRRVY